MMDTPAEPPAAKPAVRPGTPPPRARGAYWTVGLASALLLLISLGGWLYHRAQLADIVADHLRLQVSGPATLSAEVDNAYSVLTTSVTGKPIQAQIDFAISAPDGKPLRVHNEKTDENGRLTVTVPAELDLSGGARLEVSASHGDRREEVVTRLAAEPIRCVTCLTLDKPIYRPGETIRYRSLTLLRFGLSAGREVPVQFEILDPLEAPLAGSQLESVTRRGFACGEFPIPETLPGGEYTLVARSVDGQFPEQRRTFLIRRYRLPRLTKSLELTRNSYAPGDKVVAQFSVQRAEGGPAAGAELRIVAAVDGQLVHDETARASQLGTFQVEFTLLDEIEQGDAHLLVAADDGAACEAVARRIPINLGEVEVTFYPEGGYLVAGLQSRVYFAARDPLGRPVDIRGAVVDSQGQHVAGVATTHEGMGAFSIKPLPGEEYRLEFNGTGKTPQPPAAVQLPEVSSDRKVVLNTGLGVFPEGKPLEFNVRASEAGLPLVASAWCRGVAVGHQALVSKQDANPVVIALPDEAGGVIVLTVYDYSSNPPEPVAERLVYRRVARRLEVEAEEASGRPAEGSGRQAAESSKHAPGEEIDLSFSVKDEDDNPVPATLGVGMVDEALLSLARADTPTLPTQFLLATEVADPRDLEHADFYLSQSREADVALDLLLGTQGWRQLLPKTPTELRRRGRGDHPLVRMAAKVDPPAMFDNLIELQEKYKDSLEDYRANRTKTSNALTAVSFFGGLGLVFLVAMLNLLNVAGGARLWAPAVAAATVCLIVGGILMDPARWKSTPEDAVGFVPFNIEPSTLSPAEGEPEAPGAEKRQPEHEQPGKDTHQPIPGVQVTDREGHAQVGLDSSGPVATFRVLVDAYADGGRIGSGRHQVGTRLPFRLEACLPWEVGTGDRIDVPLAIVNDTDGSLPVEIVLEHGDAVQLDGEPRRKLQLEAQQRARQYFSLQAAGGGIMPVARGGAVPLTFRGTAGQLADEVTRSLKVVPPGTHTDLSNNGQKGDSACPVQLSTKLDKDNVQWCRSVVLSAGVSNTSDQRQPMTVAVLGLPAGLEVRLDQLDDLKRAGKLDLYQTRARELICYWRSLAPKKEVDLKLDLIAAVPGKFTGPASYVYLHDAPAQKQWNAPLVVEITPN